MKRIYESPCIMILEIMMEQPVFSGSDEDYEDGNSPFLEPGYDF